MKTLRALLIALTIIWGGLCFAQQCQNGPGLEPYCDLNNPPNQYHHTPPPAYDADRDKDFARDAEQARREARREQCKAGCSYRADRDVCEQRCEAQ